MQVDIDGARIWFDVAGERLRANGPELQDRPTLILVHGGPGGTHGCFKPEFCALSDVAQVIMIDLRGHGRSTGADKSRWTLAQFGADIRAFCDNLGIERPYVFGNSFGAVVVQSYAVQNPDHAAGLILSSPPSRIMPDVISANFTAKGGEIAGKAARAFWEAEPADLEEFLLRMGDYGRECLHLYSNGPTDPNRMMRMGQPNLEMLFHFMKKGGELRTFDYRAKLNSIESPTLIVSGLADPVTPIECALELVDSLPLGSSYLVNAERCGHPVFADNPAAELDAIRWFVTGGAASLKAMRTVSESVQ